MCDAGGRIEVVIVLQGMRLVKFAWQITVCSYLMLNEHLSFLRTAATRYQPPRPKIPNVYLAIKSQQSIWTLLLMLLEQPKVTALLEVPDHTSTLY